MCASDARWSGLHWLKHRPDRQLADESAPPLVLHLDEAVVRRKDDGVMIETALARARAGDGEAFRELVEAYRGELHTHCYRILGSVQDAEDVLQEALLAAWRSIGQFDGRSLRAWLYRIATNRCLNYLRDESRRPRSAGLPGLSSGMRQPVRSDEPWWLEPYPDVLLGDMAHGPEARYDARESIALSFVAGLQHLPPQQRAVLVLRDVLGFPAAEAAGILGSTPAAVNSALIRARAGIRPDRDPHDVPLPRSPAEAAAVKRFVDAFERFDLDQLVTLLTEDVKLAMPPEPAEFRGPLAIVGYLQAHLGGQELKLVPTRANNQPALALYLPDPSTPIWRASSLVVLTLRVNRIGRITRFGDRGLFAAFGLPRTLPRD
jgi:RNA polymerase sigma-70 factor (TIGR02960 family)